MKRIVTLILCLCMTLSLTVPCALAAEEKSVELLYDLTVDGSDFADVKKGDVVTVTFSILRGDDSSESYKVRTLQNEIIYDQDFFEFVPDSIEVIRGGGSALFQTRVDGTNIIKASFLSGSGSTYAAEEDFCSFQLKVIAEGGTGWVSCDWSRAKAYDSEGGSFSIRDVDGSKWSDLTMAANGKCHTFTDVAEKDWFHSAVDYAECYGLMNGVGNNLFDPAGTVTRGMVVTLLYRLEGEPAVTGSSDFTDVADGQWYSNAVTWAADQGIVRGYGDGTYGVADNITREQMATLLYRYAQYKGYDVTAQADLSGFTDAESISAWAVDSMVWANAVGLVNGRTVTTLVPLGNANRAELATILMRFRENVMVME